MSSYQVADHLVDHPPVFACRKHKTILKLNRSFIDELLAWAPDLQPANLTEIVRQNAKIASYIKKLESRDAEEPSAEPAEASDLPPASELVAEFEQFLRQQRPE